MSIAIIQEDNKTLDLNNINCPYIKKAFECVYNNVSGMTIKEFIKVSEFPIDNFMVDNFFNNLNDDIPIYITNELIEWCGFNAKSFDNKKREFNRILENFKEGKDFSYYSNKEYENYYEKSIYKNYPNPIEFKGKNKTKHLILTVECFKMILMMLNTPKVYTIRKHYLMLEKLIFTYMKYQCLISGLNYRKEIDELKNFPHVKKYSKLQRLNELELKLREQYRVGVIYFITDGEFTKIGYTFNLPERLSSLQTANPKELRIKKYYFVQFPYEEEQRLHLKYKSNRIRGEWFCL
jgi:hypothetical protein